jgi:hypothetical protein
MNPLSGYAACKSAVVTHTNDGSQTNYQMKLTIVKGDGVDAAGTTYLDNKALNWPYDIRFTKADGTTLLDFWREESDATDGTWWIEVDSIPDPDNATIYLHVGDADAIDASNGANTFKLFNDGSSVAGWTAVTLSGYSAPTWAVVSGKIRCSMDFSEASFLYCDTVVDQDNYRLHTHIISSMGVTGYNHQYGLVHQDTRANTNTGTAYWLEVLTQWAVRDSGAGLELSAADAGFDGRNDNTYDLTVDDETHTLYVNGAEKVHIHKVGWTPNYVGLLSGSYQTTYTNDFWNIFVANFTTNEPTWGAWGDWETGLKRSVPRIARIMVMSP